MPKAYEEAGVSVEAGYEVVKRIKSHVARTNRPGVVGGIGGFGGLFDLASLGYKEPVLISGTDGVGTKLVVAKMANKHNTIGIDCVAMCVNDIAAQGAEPLFFLDYIACGKNDPALLEQVVAGVADGCVQAGSGLIGGETAEMPGMYDEDEYDLAGFAVGVAEKSAIVDGSTIAEGDVLIGLPSTGVHSNGFSLVRKALFEKAGYTVDTVLDELDGEKLGDVLLTPTKIYVKALSPLFKAGVVKDVAHITDGKEWMAAIEGAYCSYGNDDANAARYGLLYNRAAVSTHKLCPEGWHVPTVDDWNKLGSALGGTLNDFDSWVGIASKLKATAGWPAGEKATDESGFGGLPGGAFRADPNDTATAKFYYAETNGYWWSDSDFSGEMTYYYGLRTQGDNLDQYVGDRCSGMSVRCVHDF